MAGASELPAAVLRDGTGALPFRMHRQWPQRAASDLVDHLWVVEWDLADGVTHTQQVLTYPCHHVTVEPDGHWVHGVVTRRFDRTLVGAGRVVGAALRVTGLAALTGRTDLSGTRDRRVPLGDLLAGDGPVAVGHATGASSAADALEEWLAVQPRRAVPGGELAARAVELAVADAGINRVEDLAARLAVSSRTLQRRLGQVLGVSPKWLVQRARIHDALETAGTEPPDWAALAQRLGFADQAHFTNAFTAMVGVSPARYVSRASQPRPRAGRRSPSSR